MMTRLISALLRPAAFVVFVLLFAAAALPAHAVEVERVVSSKGIEAWLIRDHSNPITTLKLSFRGGAALDPEGKSGLANFVASTLDEGAGDMDSRAFQRALDEKSISLRFSAGRDRLDGSLRTLNKNRDDAFEYLRLAINEPRFDETPLNRIRQQILSNLDQDRLVAAQVAMHRHREIALHLHRIGLMLADVQVAVAAQLCQQGAGQAAATAVGDADMPGPAHAAEDRRKAVHADQAVRQPAPRATHRFIARVRI